MNDSKVYHMSENMECQYLTEDSKIRIYLSPVRYERPKKRKETAVEKITAGVLALSYSAAVTYIAGQWAVRSAAQFRGYEAAGGEYILTAAVFVGSFRLMLKLLKSYRGHA